MEGFGQVLPVKFFEVIDVSFHIKAKRSKQIGDDAEICSPLHGNGGQLLHAKQLSHRPLDRPDPGARVWIKVPSISNNNVHMAVIAS